MKLEATIRQVTEEGGELSIRISGWSDADPGGTMPRALGTINVPSNERSRRAYHIGRRVWVDVRPA